MVKSFKITAVLLMLLMGSPLFSYTRIYMIPDYISPDNEVVLSDICRIEGTESSRLNGLKIPEEVYRDGIIDRRELQSVISARLSGGYFILGNGVNLKIGSPEDSEIAGDRKIILKKGYPVKIVIRNRSIKIEINGKSLSDGALGDEVMVYLKNGRKVRGKILNSRHVVVDL